MKAVNAAFVEVKTPKFTKKVKGIREYSFYFVCSSALLYSEKVLSHTRKRQ